MTNRTSASTVENSLTYSTRQTGIVLLFLLSSCAAEKKYAGTGRGILEKYYNMQAFTKDESGRFMKESERMIVDSLFPKFINDNGVIIIKEYCNSYNLSGCIYSLNTGQMNYFSRNGRNGLVNVNRPPYDIAPTYYERIFKLSEEDSLQYYKAINNKQSSGNDESCWLYVILGNNKEGKYEEKKTTFSHPLALRRLIINN